MLGAIGVHILAGGKKGNGERDEYYLVAVTVAIATLSLNSESTSTVPTQTLEPLLFTIPVAKISLLATNFRKLMLKPIVAPRESLFTVLWLQKAHVAVISTKEAIAPPLAPVSEKSLIR